MHGFQKEDLQAPLAEINMTPLVDVMLVLLVIFLVTAPMLNSAIKLNLPNEAASAISDEKPFTISINKAGQYFINDHAVSFLQVEMELKSLAAKNPKQQLHLRADIDTSYGTVSSVLGLAQRLGLNNIGFITKENN